MPAPSRHRIISLQGAKPIAGMGLHATAVSQIYSFSIPEVRLAEEDF
jgi:hypothetical protein